MTQIDLWCMSAHCGTKWVLLLLFWFLSCAAQGASQEPKKTDETATQPAPQADPADFGLLLPDAEPKPGEDRPVLVKSPNDELVVARGLFGHDVA